VRGLALDVLAAFGSDDAEQTARALELHELAYQVRQKLGG
jgi:hypothetical protein